MNLKCYIYIMSENSEIYFKIGNKPHQDRRCWPYRPANTSKPENTKHDT